MKIKAEIKRMKPFVKNRQKVQFYDKTRGMFSGLDVKQLDRFIDRNRINFKRNSPHRNTKEKTTSVTKPEAVTLDIIMV